MTCSWISFEGIEQAESAADTNGVGVNPDDYKPEELCEKCGGSGLACLENIEDYDGLETDMGRKEVCDNCGGSGLREATA